MQKLTRFLVTWVVECLSRILRLLSFVLEKDCWHWGIVTFWGRYLLPILVKQDYEELRLRAHATGSARSGDGEEMYTVAHLLEDAKRFSNQTAVRYKDRRVSFKHLYKRVTQVANFFEKELGLKQGARLALVMENRLEYIIICLAMAKIGASTALVSPKLGRGPLFEILLNVFELSPVVDVRDDREAPQPADSPFVLIFDAGIPGIFAKISALKEDLIFERGDVQFLAQSGELGKVTSSDHAADDLKFYDTDEEEEDSLKKTKKIHIYASGHRNEGKRDKLKPKPKVAGLRDFDAELEGMRNAELGEFAYKSAGPCSVWSTEKNWCTANSEFLVVYTEGLNSPPRPISISNRRFVESALRYTREFNLTGKDLIYCPNQLSQYTSFAVAFGPMLTHGISLVLKRQFIPEEYFPDCKFYGATVAMYSAEMATQLCATPLDPRESTHQVRLAMGYGMRDEVMPIFQRRFGVREINEFYATTEGLIELHNSSMIPGSIGYLPFPTSLFTSFTILKYDWVRKQPWRSRARGRCSEASQLQQLLAARVVHQEDILQGVFMEDDAYFRSRDLMKRDASGHIHFVSRIDDAYRHVSKSSSRPPKFVDTKEVTSVLHSVMGIAEANVIGMNVEEGDGNHVLVAEVKMARGVEKGGALAMLSRVANMYLPLTLRPRFVRICNKWENITGTCRHRKVGQVSVRCNPKRVAESGDEIYFYNKKKGSYEPLEYPRYKRFMKVTHGNAEVSAVRREKRLP
ncbi:hypothetical protein CYMTET_25018 [Cymbomonas tetramitiformis]|uniref:AMP-dependent synthetase/ligase domain-containing protein n=1 Tax=Cymbomonas tetramitiformis TaxID=36881 RepID=A0AAE0FW68_9CHLO|nr:hypothetical protein CYMTET_25018 [Cymbomonas tetramitiformis]